MNKFHTVRAEYQTLIHRSRYSLRSQRQAIRITTANSLDARVPARGPQRISALMNGLPSLAPKLNPASVVSTSRTCK